MHTVRRPWENEGRDHDDASVSEGIARIANKPAEARREA